MELYEERDTYTNAPEAREGHAMDSPLDVSRRTGNNGGCALQPNGCTILKSLDDLVKGALPCGVIPLANAVAVSVDVATTKDQPSRDDFLFRVTTPHREFHIMAHSHTERQQWVEDIQNVIRKLAGASEPQRVADAPSLRKFSMTPVYESVVQSAPPPDQVEDGEWDVYAWGAGTDELWRPGSPSGTAQKSCILPRPVEHLQGRRITSLSCGNAHVVALTLDHDVFTWGRGTLGQLGHGNQNNRRIPELVHGLQGHGTVQVAAGCGADWTVALTGDGTLLSWGDNAEGQLGHGDYVGKNIPWAVRTEGHVFKEVACGQKHCIALVDNGLVATWGCGDTGRLGHGSEIWWGEPKIVTALDPGTIIRQVACGGAHSALLTSDGGLMTFGYGGDGALGHGDIFNHFTPKRVQGLTHTAAAAVVCGFANTAVVSDMGEVYTFGCGDNGQLGVGHMAVSLSPVQVNLKGNKAKSISCGHTHMAVLLERGGAMTWGGRDAGSPSSQGYTRHSQALVPMKVKALNHSRLVHIACGTDMTLVVTEKSIHVRNHTEEGHPQCSPSEQVDVPKMQSFKISGVPYLGRPLEACGTPIGMEPDRIHYQWYRKNSGEGSVPLRIADATAPIYWPSPNDLGARLSARVFYASEPDGKSGVVEVADAQAEVQLDPEVDYLLGMYVANHSAEFRLLHKEETDLEQMMKVQKDRIIIRSVFGQSERHHVYTRDMNAIVLPDPQWFILRIDRRVRYLFRAKSPKARDVIVLTIRAFLLAAGSVV